MADSVASRASAFARLYVCTNRRFGSEAVSCAGRGSAQLLSQLAGAVAARGLPVAVEASICQGRCAEGPNVRLVPGPVLFDHVGPDDIPGVLDAVAQTLGQNAGVNESGDQGF